MHEPIPAPQSEAPPPLSDAIRASLIHCHDVVRDASPDLYDSLKLTPEPKRFALYTLHAFARACSDLTRAPVAADPQPALAQIEAFRAQMDQAAAPRDAPLPPGPIWPAFRHIMHTYSIDPAHLHAMLDGRRSDLLHPHLPSFPELYDHCYKAASTLELAALSIRGDDGDVQTRRLAEYRGIAFQLTHILCDLVEDASRGRVYLPADEMARFDYTAQDLARKATPVGFRRLMVYQIERARCYYQMSAPLEQHLTPDCRATSWAMTRTCSSLLDRIARSPRRVLRDRVHLSRFEKLRITLRAHWRARRAG